MDVSHRCAQQQTDLIRKRPLKRRRSWWKTSSSSAPLTTTSLRLIRKPAPEAVGVRPACGPLSQLLRGFLPRRLRLDRYQGKVRPALPLAHFHRNTGWAPDWPRRKDRPSPARTSATRENRPYPRCSPATEWNGGYQVTSAPAIASDLVIAGSSIADNWKVDTERGIVRAFDVRTGQLRWTWNPTPWRIRPNHAPAAATPGRPSRSIQKRIWCSFPRRQFRAGLLRWHPQGRR